MTHKLRIALEGEQIEVVKGMVVAVPIGQAQTINTLASESIGEAVSGAAKKVWETLAKIVAGLVAAVGGVIKWIVMRWQQGRDRPKLSDEIIRQYKLLAKSFTELKAPTALDKIDSIIKSEKLDEHAGNRLSDAAKAIADQTDFIDLSVKLRDELLNQKTQDALVSSIARLGMYAQVGPNHPSNHDGQSVQQQIDAAEKIMEPVIALNEQLNTSLEKARQAQYAMPSNLKAMAALIETAIAHIDPGKIGQTQKVWRRHMDEIERDLKKIEKNVRLGTPKEPDIDTEYRAKMMLAGFRRYWMQLTPVFHAFKYLSKAEDGVVEIGHALLTYWTEVMKVVKEYYEDNAEISAELKQIELTISGPLKAARAAY